MDGAEGRLRNLWAAHGHRAALAIALVFYAARIVPAAIEYRDRINPDAVCYLRHALYLSRGDLFESVSGYWSPLLSWCTAPFLLLGMDPLHAAHLVTAAWGGLLVFSTWLLIRRSADLGAGWMLAALLIVADCTVRWGVAVFPDGMMAAALLAALAWLAAEDVPRPFLAGLAGGIAYLAKAYAFPFFLALLLWTVVWRRLSGAWNIRTALSVLSLALVGFLVTAAPWAGLISWKYERPMFSLAGPINHAIVGPPDLPREHPNTSRLWTPGPGRLSIWETPEAMTYRPWSPLESSEYFRHQVSHVRDTAGEIVASMWRYDFIGLGLVAPVLAPLLLLWLGKRREAAIATWLTGSILLFAAGLTLVYYSYRYTDPFVRPLCVILVMLTTSVICSRMRGHAGSIVAATLAGIVLLSFSVHAHIPFRPFELHDPGGTAFDDIIVDSSLHRELAEKLQAEGIEGPLASTMHWGGLYLAYHMEIPYLGTPAPGGGLEELRSHGAATFLVEEGARWDTAQMRSDEWILLHMFEPVEGHGILVYSRKSPASLK